jgi:hypothetical protein
MAWPRVFVSSTYYDLKHIRASLSSVIDTLGYESVFSEKEVLRMHTTSRWMILVPSSWDDFAVGQ